MSVSPLSLSLSLSLSFSLRPFPPMKFKFLHEAFKIKPRQAQALHADAQEPAVFNFIKFSQTRKERGRVMTKNNIWRDKYFGEAII